MTSHGKEKGKVLAVGRAGPAEALGQDAAGSRRGWDALREGQVDL